MSSQNKSHNFLCQPFVVMLFTNVSRLHDPNISNIDVQWPLTWLYTMPVSLKVVNPLLKCIAAEYVAPFQRGACCSTLCLPQHCIKTPLHWLPAKVSNIMKFYLT